MLKRRKFVATAVVFVLSAVGLAWWTATWEPSFYSRALQSGKDPESLRRLSKSMVQKVMQFADEVRHEPTFEVEFSEDQVNAWLADELEGKYRGFVPLGITQPRIHFDERLFEIAFRIRRGSVSAVASSRVTLSVTSDHLLALEIESLRAGRFPLPVADLLEPLVQRLRRENYRVEWRQINGQETLVVDLLGSEGDSPESATGDRVLETVELKPGVLRLKGGRRVRKAR